MRAEILSVVRMPGLDALRGLAVVLMMQQHLLVWFWNHHWTDSVHQYQGYQLLMGFNALGGLAAPLFVIVAGVGVSLYVHTHVRHSGVLFVRGAVLLVLGYALNFAVPSWFTPASWYVLHLIGSGLVWGVVMNHFSVRWQLLVAAVVMGLSPLLQHMLQTPLLLSNARMGQGSLGGGVWRLILVEGHFPLFPWLGMFMMGQSAGVLLSRYRLDAVVKVGIAVLGLGGIAAGVGAFVSAAPGDFWYGYVTLRPRIYPLYFPLFALLSGCALLLVSAAVYYGHLMHAAHPLVSLGRSSLSLFVLHVIAVRQGGHWWGFFKQFSTALSIVLSLSCIAGAFGLAHVWRRIDYRFGIEWLLRSIDRGSLVKKR